MRRPWKWTMVLKFASTFSISMKFSIRMRTHVHASEHMHVQKHNLIWNLSSERQFNISIMFENIFVSVILTKWQQLSSIYFFINDKQCDAYISNQISFVCAMLLDTLVLDETPKVSQNFLFMLFVYSIYKMHLFLFFSFQIIFCL